MSAQKELERYLEDGEHIEAIVFGNWGWGGDYNEPDPVPVHRDKRGVVMSYEDAIPMLQGWSVCGGYGAPNVYAMYAWTSQRVIFINNYDGGTCLMSVPRNPSNQMPELTGGG